MDLRFESGKVAGARGWHSVEIVDTALLGREAPSPRPLLVEAAADSLTVESARTIAALHAAGRSVVLVTDSPLGADVAQWIPEECVHLLGAPISVVDQGAAPGLDAQADGVKAFFGSYAPEFEGTGIDRIAEELEAHEVMALAQTLESTAITIDTDRDWWMRGSICLHHVAGGWDARNDIVADLGFVALPLKIGNSLVLGVGDIQGQECDEGCYVVTGSWRRAEDGRYGGIYTDGTRDVSRVSVDDVLLWSGVQEQSAPDPLPLSVRTTHNGEKAVLEVENGMLLDITRKKKKKGAHGFQAARPLLQTWLDEYRTAAAEYLRSYA